MGWFFSTKKKEYSILGYANTIEFKLDKKFDFVYGILIEYNGGIANHSIHFLCELNYKNNYTVEVNQKQVYINDQLPDMTMEALADDIRKKMYPIEFNLGSNGHLIGLSNYDKYQETWSINKNLLEKRYKGFIATNIIEDIQLLIENKQLYLNKIKENLFLQFMFLPIYNLTFNSNYERSIDLCFKLYKNLPEFMYRVNFKISKTPTATNKVFIAVKGHLVEQEYYDYHKIKNSEFKFYLKLNIENKLLFSIEGEINSIINGKNEQIKLSSYLQE